MTKHAFLAAAAALALAAAPALAADFSDPTWPCVQRKVETLSPGLMWPEPLPDAAQTGETGTAAEQLAELLSLRRVDLETARAEVAAFTEAEGDAMPLLAAVFSGVFDRLSHRRTRIIDGIGKFSLGQIELSEKIDAARAEMDAQMALDAPDYDRVDALEEQIDWDQRIFTDRQNSIRYLCETPQLLEQRLYAIAQMLHAAGKAETPADGG
ncbi:hypothetical protein [Alloyangia pacifica]|uniref:hypothetical protein n=1 Tax=Alloyangia pacifica TaxID=311180 RepID=UPI001CFF2786|nr:hypothetical protein [Alloyangia pacifica]